MTTNDNSRFRSTRTDYRFSGVRNTTYSKSFEHISNSVNQALFSDVKEIMRSPVKRLLYISTVVLLVFSICAQLFLLKPSVHAQTLSAGPNGPGTCADDNGVGTQTWNNPSNASTSGGLDVRATSSVTTSNRTSHYLKCTDFGFSIPSAATVVGVVLTVERSVASNNSNGVTDSSIKLVKANAIQGSSRTTITTWPTTDAEEDHGGSTDLWGSSWTASDINDTTFGAAVSAALSIFASNNNTARVDTMTITVYYAGISRLGLDGYIWENDDEDQASGDVYDENSQQAAGSTALTNVRRGERATLRMQLKNTGGVEATSNLGLFYDKNDGNFRRVTFPRPSASGGSGCASGATDWGCTLVHATGTTGQNAKITIGKDGNPAMVYTRTTNDIVGAEYVGSGGNCDSLGGSDAWSCETVDTGTGTNMNVATGPDGKRYGLYYTNAGSSNFANLAEYVGSDNGSGCTSSAWTCTSLGTDTNAVAGTFAAELGVADDGTVYAVITDGLGASATTKLCIRSGGSWSCNAWANLADTSFGSNGDTKAMVYQNTSNDLVYAEYVGSGGNCTDTRWQCTTIDDTATDIGRYNSLAFSPDGTAYISYNDTTNGDLRLAHYVGSSGSGCKTGVTDWTCEDVDDSNEGQYTSLAFSPAGTPYISYYDNGSTNLNLANYVGSGGSCSNTAWDCMTVDDTVTDVGKYTSITFDNDGAPYIAYYDETSDNVRVATLPVNSGEMSLAKPGGGADGDSINESHADMTSVSDTTNRNDVDCISSGTWGNGKLFGREEGVGISIPADGCTEVAFVIDTSQAVDGATYRFIVASADSFQEEKGKWRGLDSVTDYPTLTIAADTDYKANKVAEPQGTACNGSVWTCTTIEGTNAVGEYSSLAFSPDGVPYISFYDTTNDDLRFAKYVGSGGNCDASGGSDAWTCTTLDDTVTDVGQYTSIAFNPITGYPSISYYAVTGGNLRVAEYVGSGGTGCKTGVTDWTCTAVEVTNDVGKYSSIAFSPGGRAYISYFDTSSGDLRLSYYDGDSTSSGCGGGSNAWTCEQVDTSATTVGQYASIAVSSKGIPYISYYDATNFRLRVAQYVSAGGTGCTASAHYTCTTVDVNGTIGDFSSIALDGSDAPFVSYHEDNSDLLRIAQYVGSGGNCDATGGSDAWNCTTLDDTTATGKYTAVAFGPDNSPWVSYWDEGNGGLRAAEYVGSGGTGCKSGLTTWKCVTVDAASGVGQYSSIAFSPTGLPYISYSAAGDLKLAKIDINSELPSYSSSFAFPGRSARWANGTFSLADGRAPRTNSDGACGSATGKYIGICGLFDDGGDADTINASAGERPMFTFAKKFTSNSMLPTATWAGGTTVPPSTAGSTGDIKLQVYKFGSTNAWQDVATNSSSATCTFTDNCRLSGIPSGTISDYYQSDGGSYWMYWRVWQTESSSSAETFSTDLLQFQFINTQMRHGKLFNNNVRRVYTF